MNSYTDLVVVGTGIAGPGHVTVEARAAIHHAETVFALVADALTRHWIWSTRPDAEDLSSAYGVGRPRTETYLEMVDRILEAVRAKRRVCAVFYGHPGVFVFPSHEVIGRARAEGYTAKMLPAVSAEDCLFADLGVDPGRHGCQSFEATDFLVQRRIYDPTSGLLIWQAGAIGVSDYREELLWNREGLRVLTDTLGSKYPLDHQIVIYEASTLPVGGPRVVVCQLKELPSAPVTALSTLWIKPLPARDPDRKVLQRLGLVD